MTALTKQQVLNRFNNEQKDALFCPYCYDYLLINETNTGTVLYCPNEMCLSEEHYNENGTTKEDE